MANKLMYKPNDDIKKLFVETIKPPIKFNNCTKVFVKPTIKKKFS